MQHLNRVDQQSEQEEHPDLHHPSEPVEERENLFAVVEFAVSDEDAGDVDGEVTIAGKHAGERICEEYDAQEHNRIERGVVKLHLVQKPYRCIPYADSHCSSDYEL